MTKPKSTSPYQSIKRFLIPALVAFLLSTMAAQMLIQANLDGASSDEQIHIISGYTTLTQGHVLFDPEHPFLAKAVAAIPLLFTQPNVPQSATHLRPRQAEVEYNTYWEANRWGYEMLFESGNNPDQLLFLTRAMMAIFTVLLALVVFCWTRSLWGTASALAGLIIIAFEPTILAHGHLANDDTFSTLLFVGSIAAFFTYLKKPTYKHILIAGGVLGLGLITKYSLLLLGPTFIILLIGWIVYQRQKDDLHPAIFTKLASNWQRYSLGLISIFIVAWSIIWIGYGSLTLINPTQNPTTITNTPKVPDLIAKVTPYVLPVMYAKGAGLLFDPSSNGRHGYLLGACYTGGRLDYFITTALFKIPLPTIGLFCFSLWLWWQNRRNNKYIPIILITSIIIYLSISNLSKINIGFRHVLPVYVLVIIAAPYPFSLVNWRKYVYALKQLLTQISPTSLRVRNQDFKPLVKPTLLITALISIVLSGILSFPNHLAYYNILAGEPRNIPFISADSNVDWGQGSKLLHRYMIDHHIDQLAFDNFTGNGESQARDYSMSVANPDDHQYRGYLALSRSVIIDHMCTKNNDWGWVTDHYQPIAIIGNTINLYRLE